MAETRDLKCLLIEPSFWIPTKTLITLFHYDYRHTQPFKKFSKIHLTPFKKFNGQTDKQTDKRSLKHCSRFTPIQRRRNLT